MFLFIHDGYLSIFLFQIILSLGFESLNPIHTIHADAISKVRICEDLFAVRYRQRCSPAPACGGIEGLEGRDR
jgi:hypothetical protein